VDVPERGLAWSTYMANTKSATRDLLDSMWTKLEEDEPVEQVRLVAYDPEGETRVSRQSSLATRRCHTTKLSFE